MSKIELVKKYILKEITQRKIMEGQRVPGCREIAQILSVNKITVNKAYKDLEEEHFLYCVPRGGYYVIKSNFEEAQWMSCMPTGSHYLPTHGEYILVINVWTQYWKN